MDQLAKSRAKFFATHDLPTTGTFWLYLLDRHLDQGNALSDEDRRICTEWEPRNSNCPLLSASLETLVGTVPGIWRADAKAIFAGRTISPEVNASSWRSDDVGVVEIDYQFSIVLEDYVDAFDEFVRVIRSALADIAEKPSTEATARLTAAQEQLASGWSTLGGTRRDWESSRYIHPGSGAFVRPMDREEACRNLASACETFVLGHELAHHLLGDTYESPASRRKKRKVAQDVLEELYARTNLQEVTTGLTSDQVREIHCDAISFMIMAGGVGETATYPDIYRATAGAMVTLTALGHVSGNWQDTTPDSTHPGVRRRLQAIGLAVIGACNGRTDRGPVGDHPLGLFGQLKAFARLAEHTWWSDHRPEEVPPVRIVDHLGLLMNDVEAILRTLSEWDPERRENRVT